MAFFDSFTDSIKQKWLQFFQANRDWIILHMEAESVYTPDGGKRPSSHLILGVVNALEPKLAQLMLPFSKLNPDADTLIDVLDLHFDPDIILGNRVVPKVEPGTVVNDTDEDWKSTHESVESIDNVSVKKLSSVNGNNSQQEFEQPLISDTVDEFGDISFDNITGGSADDLSPQEDKTFGDVLSDVWGDRASGQKGEENSEFLGDELPSGVFDDSEIARLFPNS